MLFFFLIVVFVLCFFFFVYKKINNTIYFIFDVFINNEIDNDHFVDSLKLLYIT